jgi:hypothetical protein
MSLVSIAGSVARAYAVVLDGGVGPFLPEDSALFGLHFYQATD